MSLDSESPIADSALAAGSLDFNVLLAELGLQVTGPASAAGECRGVPTALTILSHDPPAIMVEFRIHQPGNDAAQLHDLLQGAPEDQARLSIEGSSAFLSLYNLTGQSNDTVRQMLDGVAETIQATDLRIEPGCLRCGETESARLTIIAEHPTRLCPSCRDAVMDAHAEAEADLNRTTLSATFGIPAALAMLAIGWGLYWWLLEELLQWMGVKQVELNRFTWVIVLAILAAGAYPLSRIVAGTFRRSALTRGSPRLLTAAFLFTTIFAGEVVYFCLILFRQIGIFAPQVAFQFIGDFLTTYPPFWGFCKLLMAAGIYGFVVHHITQTRTAKIEF